MIIIIIIINKQNGEPRCGWLGFILRTVIFSSILTSGPQSLLQMWRGKGRAAANPAATALPRPAAHGSTAKSQWFQLGLHLWDG